MCLQEGSEYEQTPDAVDDAGNAREQLDGDANRSAQRHGAKLGQEDRGAEPDGDGDKHRDKCGDERAADGGKRSELLRNRVPRLGDEEIKPEGLKGECRANDERRKDGTEHYQNANGRRFGRAPEYRIATAEALHNIGAGLIGDGTNRLVQDHVYQGPNPTLTANASNQRNL